MLLYFLKILRPFGQNKYIKISARADGGTLVCKVNFKLCCKFSKSKFMKMYVLVVGSFSKLNRRTINRNLTKMEINGQKLGDG